MELQAYTMGFVYTMGYIVTLVLGMILMGYTTETREFVSTSEKAEIIGAVFVAAIFWPITLVTYVPMKIGQLFAVFKEKWRRRDHRKD